MMKNFMTIKEMLKNKERISDSGWTEYYEEADNEWFENTNHENWDACLILPGSADHDHCVMFREDETWMFFRRER